MSSDVVIKKSNIHGNGVFANKGFKKGEIIIQWSLSHILTPEQVDKLPKSELKYVSPFDKNKFILHAIPERFINHSCNPNTIPKNNADVAVRPIKKGEEITTDYTKENVKISFACNCPKHKK